eukprot:TRINITY_DN3503_c0_g1_i2.p1 TRINITY_DN3503_c0_g1~~TRINITY_DN3503_c0_g1_i2.p1  ORF type:complete len:391 (-),score=86.55 TRINITY_DN3503_c0_g1_i2:470-1642(-)
MNEEEIKKLFETLDTNHNGVIERDELISGLRLLHLPTDPAMVDKFFDSADDNKDGVINEAEFLQFMNERKKDLRKLFDVMDKNHHGVLTEEEITELVHSAGLKTDKKQIESLILRADTDGNHEIDFHEFCQFLSLLPFTNVDEVLSVWQKAVALDIGEEFAIPPDHADRNMETISKYLLAGGIAGMISRSATAPLDRLKIILQTSNTNQGIVKSFTNIYHQEGVKGYWRGNLANVIKIFPESGIRFLSFESYKRMLFPESDPLRLGPFEKLLAGGLAGATSQISIYPMEVVRARLAVAGPGVYSGIGDVITQTIKKEGPMTFYKGLLPSLAGIFPYAAIDFAIYDHLKGMYIQRKKGKVSSGENTGISIWVLLGCGAISSSIGQLGNLSF